MPGKFGGLPIDPTRLPRHIGIIMDGNGRWATRRGLDRTRGHRAGSRAVREVVKACRSMGVPTLTLFAFSAQNWERPRSEVLALMDLLGEFIASEWREIMERDIRVVQLGESRRVPVSVRRQLRELIRETRRNRSMTLALALSYGAREEIVRAARILCRRVTAGKMACRELDEQALSDVMYTHGMPDPDLIIRTGGERRVSNFLLWQSAYTEYVFSQKLWPDFKAQDLRQAVLSFQKRRRRYGLTDEQILKPRAEGD